MGTKVTTNTRGLTDAKTDPKFGPVVSPLVRELVIEVTNAEATLEGVLWKAIANAQKCKFEEKLEEAEVKRQVRQEIDKKFKPEEAATKAYRINRAIKIAYMKTLEEVALYKRQGKAFDDLYLECSTKRKFSRATNTSEKDVMNSPNGEQPKKQTKGWNRFEQEEEKENTGFDLEEGAKRLAFREKLTKEMVYRILEIFFGEDFDTTKDFMMFLLEENEWALDAAREFCKEHKS